MFAAIAYNLRNLANFRGRDGRAVFWNYFLFVVIVNFLVMLAASIPTFGTVLAEAGSVAKAGGSAAIEGAVLDSMINLGLPGILVRTGLWLGALDIILLAASLTRRAHDSGLPGLVLVIPVGLQLVWMYFSYRQLDGLGRTFEAAVEATQAGDAPQVQVGMIAQDLIGWLAVLIVIAIGMIKSQRTPNQYADGPTKV